MKSTLFGIVAAPSELGPGDVARRLDAAISTRIAGEPTSAKREILLNDLADVILADPRWLTSDVVTRAANNFVSALMLNESNLVLVTWFEYALRRLNKAIDLGWSERYRSPSNPGAPRAPADRLQRLESIAQLQEKIHNYRMELPRSMADRLYNGALLCSVAFWGPKFKPHL